MRHTDIEKKNKNQDNQCPCYKKKLLILEHSKCSASVFQIMQLKYSVYQNK